MEPIHLREERAVLKFEKNTPMAAAPVIGSGYLCFITETLILFVMEAMAVPVEHKDCLTVFSSEQPVFLW